MRENFTLVDSKMKPEERGRKTTDDEDEEIPLLYEKKGEKYSQLIPSYFLLVLLGYLFTLGVFTAMIDDALPGVVSKADAGYAEFSEERAWEHLREIVGKGPRVAGTEYHLAKTRDLKAMLDKIAGGGLQRVHTDWQMVSGAYWLGTSGGHLNVYGNLSNVIALVEGESGFNADGTTNSSILVNCHYDSVPTSPGASDNALFCAAMVDTLLVLSRRGDKFKHNIVFLFNGAEENPLQGSAGFLQHPWSKGVTALVNLDAAGTNCKAMLFQVSDPRVIRSYKRSVSMPSAQAAGEVLFSSGIVPSDTDFRIFRDLGQIYGVDIAFSKWGHVYHTRHDSLRTIVPGVLQHSGNMLLALVNEMADGDEYYNKGELSSTVYFDFLNLFMVTYGFTAAYIMDSVVLVLGICSVLYYHFIVGFRWRLTRELGLSVLARVLSAVAGAACVAVVAGLVLLASTQLRYLSNSWLVVPMFWFPYVMGATFASQMFDAWRARKSGLSRVRRAAQAMAATRLLLCVAVLLLLCLRLAATARYALTAPLLVMAVASAASLTLLHRGRAQAYQLLLLDAVLTLPAQMLYFVMAVKVDALMLPIMGRNPTNYPDLYVAGLNLVLVILCSLPLSGVELLFSRRQLWAVCAGVAVVSLAVSLAPMRPYHESETSPVLQRHYWFHSEVSSFDATGAQNSSTGVWMGHTSAHTPHEALAHWPAGLPAPEPRVYPVPACVDRVYCGLPVFYPRVERYTPDSIWVNFTAPSPATPAPLLQLQNKTCDGDNCTLHLTMTGPPHMSLVIWPRDNVTLTNWSFEPAVRATTTLLHRPVYYVFYSRGTYSERVEPLLVALTFHMSGGGVMAAAAAGGVMADIAFIAHRIYHPEEFTADYRQLLAAMPDYYNIATFLSTRHDHVF